ASRQKIWFWYEVCVKYRDEFRRSSQIAKMNQRVVDIARFGVGIILARNIAAAVFLAKLSQPFSAPIVTDPDSGVRMVHGHCAYDRLLQNKAILVIGADQDIDERSRLALQPRQISFNIWRPIANLRQKK